MVRRAFYAALILFIICQSPTWGQSGDRPTENAGQKSQKYSLGVRLGPNFTLGKLSNNLSDTILNSHSHKPKVGFSVAAQVIFPLKNDFGCLIELGYLRGGRRISYNEGDWENNFTYNFYTASLALRKTFKLNLRQGTFYNWFVGVGPNISYLINGRGAIKTSNGGKTPFTLAFSKENDEVWLAERKLESDVNTYYFNNPNRFFFGLDLAIGADVPITKRQKIYSEFRVTLGQTHIKKRETIAYLNTIGGEGNLEPDPIYKPSTFSDPLKTNLKTFNFSVAYTIDFDNKASKKGKSTIKNKNNKRRLPVKRRR